MAVATVNPADHGLSDEQRDFVAAIRDFAARECSPEKRAALDGDRNHSQAIADKLAGVGWYGLQIDEEYGGSGGSFFDATLFLEETQRGLIPVTSYGVTLIVVGAINRFGTEGQKAELLRRVTEGGNLAIAMSEPNSGSDVASLSCRARRDGDEWVLNGTKLWISYAREASHTLIVCRTEEGSQRHDGLSMIFVPREAEGFAMSPIDTMGGDHTNELHLEDVRVPAENLLGEEGHGWTQLMAGLNKERVILAAQALGMAQRSFDDTLEYVKERKQFGKPVGSFQVLQHRLADLATDLARTRLLVRWVAQLTDEDPTRMLPAEASMAKLAATELAKKCALEAVQMGGGAGYATEYPMEGHLREAVVTTIYGGTSEIQRGIIAKTLGL
jgi:alkylation response protein AidB-like acyl-CoA dehydrogenase